MMSRRQSLKVRIPIMIIVLALGIGSAVAWCPDPPLSLADEFRQSTFVLTGRVIAESVVDRGPNRIGGKNYVVVVTEILRGKPPKKITIFSEDSSGRFPMVPGARYILFVTKQTVEAFSDPVYTVDNCGHSGRLPGSSKVLDEARRLAKVSALQPPHSAVTPLACATGAPAGGRLNASVSGERTAGLKRTTP
jgi:hypothetical protein